MKYILLFSKHELIEDRAKGKKDDLVDTQVLFAANDTENEIVRKLTLGEVTEDTLTSKYFSIMVVKRV